jgi:adenine-specific DNA-methyltransferase
LPYQKAILKNSIPASKTWIHRLYYGDNMEILKALLDDHFIKGKVRLLYIDPPFGTGQNFTVSSERHSTISRVSNGRTAYNDTIRGKKYLEFLRPRLELLHELLADDGSIYVHIDCKIGHYVKILMDEIFGINNFRNDITRIKCNPKNFKRHGYSNIKDMILFYSKSKKFVWNHPREPFMEKELFRLFPKIDHEGRRYTTTPLHAPGETKNGPSGKIWKGLKPPPGRHWRYSPGFLTELDEKGLIEWSSTGNPRMKKYADEALKSGKFLQDVWVFNDPQYPVYPTEKNLDLLKVIISASSNPGDLIMDCFCGSGTALVAAQEMGRQFIGIDNSDVAIKICKKKLSDLKQLKLFGLK